MGRILRDTLGEGQTLGGQLQNARERQGLSISNVAKLSGVQKKTPMNWGLDRSEPRSNRLLQLASVHGVQAAFFLDGEGADAPCHIDPGKKSKRHLQILRRNLKRWRAMF